MIALRNMHNLASAFGACCALLALAVFSSAAWAQAGYVHEVSGNVSIHRVSDRARPAKAGDTFETDTVFRTGTDGKAILKFADGAVVALGADSAMRVGQYRCLASNLRQSSSTVELMKGEMRFVTGLIGEANREGLRIIAGSSAISIQKAGGADFTVAVNPDPQKVGYAVVALGEISVRTPYGPIYRITTGQYVPWRSGRSPSLPMPVAAAPAVVQAAAAALGATLLPTDTRMAVASAACTAVASAARAAVASAARSAAAAEVGPAMAAVAADPRQAGYVDAVSNTVFMQRASGRAVTANAGDMFQAATTFDTGTDGRVVLKFADGQVVVLGPASILGVDQYQFDPSNIKASRSAVDLIDGAMRYSTGVIHTDNHEGVSISAGASVVDILNAGFADFTLIVDTKGQEVGVAAVTAGEIAVHTPYGLIGKIATGETGRWQPGRAPLPPEPLTGAPAAIQAGVAEMAATVFATVLATLPPTAAGPAQAQVPAAATAPAETPIPTIPAVTPGAGGGCSGSRC